MGYLVRERLLQKTVLVKLLRLLRLLGWAGGEVVEVTPECDGVLAIGTVLGRGQSRWLGQTEITREDRPEDRAGNYHARRPPRRNNQPRRNTRGAVHVKMERGCAENQKKQKDPVRRNSRQEGRAEITT